MQQARYVPCGSGSGTGLVERTGEFYFLRREKYKGAHNADAFYTCQP